MGKALRLLTLLVLLPLFSSATHVVGGSLTYEHLGGSTYRLTLKLYRDCRPGNAAFPNPVDIFVADSAGNVLQTVSINFPGATAVQPYIDTCAANPGLCLEEAIYTRIVNGLPPRPGGYHMWYQYCCRNNTLSNCVNPLGTGETWYAYIPDNGILITNSSPTWVNPPPVFVCQGRSIDFDHSATDADGDSLVYSWFTPYNGDTGPGPLDATVNNGNFICPTMTWVGGYGPNNPCGGANLNVGLNNGYITGSPMFTGQFVAGIKCEEYRNGVKIGEILRDFQFNVVNCPPVAQALIGTTQGVCGGATVQFDNQSDSASTYLWYFGDPSVTNDSSNAINPTWTYPGLGPYNVTLIINPYTACADTDVQVLSLSFSTAYVAAYGDTVCVNQVVQFNDSSVSSPNATITGWFWDFGDNTTSTLQNPTHAYPASGTYTVTHVAINSLSCTDTVQTVIYVRPPPIALAGNDTLACTNNPTVPLGGNVLNISSGQWIGNGTFTPNNTTLNATYTPTPAEVAQGFVDLILITTGFTFCVQDTDTINIAFYPGPTVQAGPDIYVCQDTVSVPVSGSVTVASGGAWSTLGTGTFQNANNLNTLYFPGTSDTAAGQVTLVLTSTGNGNCLSSTDTVIVFFGPPPAVTATANDTACSGMAFPVIATTATGSGVWTTLGDGTFPGGNTSLTSTYLPGAQDMVNGTVSLIFTSTNNGGCQPQSVTVQVTIIPSPTAAFASASVCPGVPMSFTDQSTSPTSIVGWSWNFGDSGTSSSQNPSHVYGAGGTYTVTLVVTSTNGCFDTLQQAVNVYPFPQPAFSATGHCLNEPVQFTDMSTISSGTVTAWQWSFGDSNGSAVQNPLYSYASSGVYNVTLIAVSNQGCQDTITQSVTIDQSPTAQFTATPPSANTQQPVNFLDQSFSNIITWYWNFGDSGATSTQQNPTYSYNDPGSYQVMLVVTDANGCIDTAYYDIIIAIPPVVPSGFSPNGDGVNDVFFVRGGPFEELELRIYNNWGEQLFLSRSQQQGWDGTRDGVLQPIGVYIYTVRAVTFDGKEYKLSGDVTLLR
ncbi:MAG: hypothetical protein FD123_3697 [Bacteroidetes bacterium]|nr:MAG: hypothetical protein FD123_3697 [Bacteroidota bacterium]